NFPSDLRRNTQREGFTYPRADSHAEEDQSEVNSPPIRAYFESSRPQFPAIQVLLLLVRQCVDHNAHRLEFEQSDPLVDGFGHTIGPIRELTLHLDRPLGRECLSSKAHVHDAGWMPMRGGEIDEPTLSQHIEPAAVGKDVLIDELANLLIDGPRQLRQV